VEKQFSCCENLFFTAGNKQLAVSSNQ